MLRFPATGPVPRRSLRATALLTAVLLLTSMAAPGAHPATLVDALQHALQRRTAAAGLTAPVADAPRWLAGPPSLAATHLETDRAQGTDETELSLNFPVKSPLARRSDLQLQALEPRLEALAQRYRAWYLSGVLRDLYARYREAGAALDAAQRGSALLQELEQQVQRQVEARASERFALLAVRQARLDAEQQLAGLEATREQAQRQFQALTGLSALPAHSGDDAPLPAQPDYARHPQLALLDLGKQRAVAALRSGSPAAAAWNVALIGRELSIPRFTERQFGLAVEVPLGVTGNSAATRSALQALERDYLLQRDRLLADLRRRWRELMVERSALAARAAGGDLFAGADPAGLFESTRGSRELPIEIRVARLRSLLDAQAERALTAARLATVEAALRQLAGEGL